MLCVFLEKIIRYLIAVIMQLSPIFFPGEGLAPLIPSLQNLFFLGVGGGCATSLQLHVGIKYLQLYIHVFCYLVLYCLVIHVTIYTMQLYFVI